MFTRFDHSAYELIAEAERRSGRSKRVTFTLFDKDIERLERLSQKFTFGNKSLLVRSLLVYLDRQEGR
jgi:hypothetical protein